MNMCKFRTYCHRHFNFGAGDRYQYSLSWKMAYHGLDSVTTEIHSYLFIPANMDTNSSGFGFVHVPGTVVKPKAGGTAVAWSIDDT